MNFCILLELLRDLSLSERYQSNSESIAHTDCLYFCTIPDISKFKHN